MDIAKLPGIIGIIVTTMLEGGEMSMFINAPGLMVVVGGVYAGIV